MAVNAIMIGGMLIIIILYVISPYVIGPRAKNLYPDYYSELCDAVDIPDEFVEIDVRTATTQFEDFTTAHKLLPSKPYRSFELANGPRPVSAKPGALIFDPRKYHDQVVANSGTADHHARLVDHSILFRDISPFRVDSENISTDTVAWNVSWKDSPD